MARSLSIVITGLVPVIHAFFQRRARQADALGIKSVG